MPNIVLRNGVEIPQVGLGTWRITDRNVMREVIYNGFSEGYRLIDTAAAYSNEISVARAIRESGISREEVVLSDKAWNTYRGYAKVQEACRQSMKKMKMDYLDIYLIHWPASPRLYPDWEEINAETWRGMEQLYRDGLVRAIGVCNFKKHHLEKLKKSAEIMPFLLQTEIHPGFNQDELLGYCNENDIIVEAASPLGNGQILGSEMLGRIATDHGRSVAQVCIRWAVQKGLIVIPKTEKLERLRENMDVYGFTLSPDDMKEIDSVPYCGGLGIDPDEVTEFG